MLIQRTLTFLTLFELSFFHCIHFRIYLKSLLIEVIRINVFILID